METFTLPIQRSRQSRLAEVDFSQLDFGRIPADHMLLARYRQGAWEEPHIIPFGELSLSPFALCLHYGQTVFEGLKAYRMADGNVSIFRPDKHHERLNRSLERMCMPPLPRELYREGLHALIETDQQWVSGVEGTSLYIRPFMIATEPKLGVKVSDEYQFLIVTTPVGPVFSRPLRVKVETTYVRAAEGGTGYAKCGGNYGGAFYPTQLARQAGFDQVLWTDSRENAYIEESGMMNVVFVFDDAVVTPPLSPAILDGVTRDSLLTLVRELGIRTEERKVSVQEMEERLKNGSVWEACGVGTAAVVGPIGEITIGDRAYPVPTSEGSVLLDARKRLENIRRGLAEDTHHWNYIVRTNK